MYDALFYLQRHDIFKKRIDAHSNVIEVKQDGIGAPKVSKKTILWHTSSASIFFLTYLVSDGYQYIYTQLKHPNKNESAIELAAQESAWILAE